jgi:hypothetical protein
LTEYFAEKTACERLQQQQTIHATAKHVIACGDTEPVILDSQSPYDAPHHEDNFSFGHGDSDLASELSQALADEHVLNPPRTQDAGNRYEAKHFKFDQFGSVVKFRKWRLDVKKKIASGSTTPTEA